MPDVFKINEEPSEEEFDLYKYYADNPNNFSKWYEFIKDNGVIDVPRTVYFKTPEEVVKACFLEKPNRDYEIIIKWLKETVIPELTKQKMLGICTIKNGTFSNKFDSKYMHQVITPSSWINLAYALANINYMAEMVDANGLAEFVVREDIMARFKRIMPCIYNGLPLTNEYRVFYDFDKHRVCYIVNYWDKEYCLDSIKANDYTDGFVFEHFAPEIEKHFQENKDNIADLVGKALKNVKMTGQWSVDILERPDGKLYLIDMALANQSAYYDPDKMEEK